MSGLDLSLLDGEVAVCRLDPRAPFPDWPRGGEAGIVAITTTPSETSIVCGAGSVPDGVECTRGWRTLVVDGILEHSLTGVLASLAEPLADASVPVFAMSTFDTDYLLVPGAALEAALGALRSAGHRID